MILGLDPSTKGTGWGIITDDGTLCAYGAIRPPSYCDTNQKKLLYIHNEIVEIINTYEPDEIASENQFKGKNAKTYKVLSQLMGSIMLASAKADIEIVYYWPTTIKVVTQGSGKASKKEMVNAICTRFNIEGIDDDTADAIGVAYTHFIKRGAI